MWSQLLIEKRYRRGDVESVVNEMRVLHAIVPSNLLIEWLREVDGLGRS